MQFGIPHFRDCLFLEPFLDDQQTVYHARLVLLSARTFRRPHDRGCDNATVCFRYLPLVQLIRNHGFNLVFETQGDFRDFSGGDWGRNDFATRREDWDEYNQRNFCN